MFARVSTYEIPDGRMDDAVTSFRTALEEIGDLDGFSEGFFIVSGEEEKATALTLWTTRRGARGESHHREPASQRRGSLDRQLRRERPRVRGRGARASAGAELGTERRGSKRIDCPRGLIARDAKLSTAPIDAS